MKSSITILMVTNAYPTDERPYSGTAVRIQELGLLKLGINVHILFIDRQSHGKLVYFNTCGRIKKEVEACKADLVHMQFGGIQAMQAIRAVGDRSILTFHGTDLHGGNPSGPIQKTTNRLSVVASRWAAERSGWNILVSSSLRPYLGKNTGKTTVIPTGVDYNTFCPMDMYSAKKMLNLNPNLKYVLFCDNNYDPIKRRDIAKLSIEHVKHRMSGVEILELNHVPHNQVPFYLNASTCLLVTSDDEGSPNIVKEAIACNLPIISVDVGDIPERLQGISNCYIIERNPSDIGDALLMILNSGERSDGREKKQHELANLAVCKKIVNVYESVLEKSRKRSI